MLFRSHGGFGAAACSVRSYFSCSSEGQRAPVHRAVGNTIGNDSTALLISKKLPYYISKYTVGEFRKIFHLAYFLATVRLDLLIGEIKK